MPAAQRRTTAAQKADALGQSVTVPFEGNNYEIAAIGTWDIEILEASENGLLTVALRKILGEEQYAELRKRVTTVAPMRELYQKIYAAAVGAEGNS